MFCVLKIVLNVTNYVTCSRIICYKFACRHYVVKISIAIHYKSDYLKKRMFFKISYKRKCINI